MRPAKKPKNRPSYTSDAEGNVHITFAAYDRETAMCERIKKDADEQKKKSRFLFMYKTSFPLVRDMERMDLEKNFGKYFVYLLFYYENDIPELHNNLEYQASKKYLNRLFQKKVIFEDNEDENENTDKE